MTDRELDDVERAALTAARAVQERLVGLALGGGRASAVELVPGGGWLGQVLARLPAGIRLEPRGLSLVLGAAWAVAEVARAVGGAVDRLEVDIAIDVVTRAASLADDGLRGYLPIGDGWVSLALGADERALWQRFLAANDATRSADLAAAAQEWGIACLPVAPLTKDALPTLGGAEPPRPVRAGAAALWQDRSVLRGARVVDCGALVSAPLAGDVLRAFGAQVTAVAHPSRVAVRWYGGPAMPLDLAEPAGRDAFAALCAEADLVLDNFSPRVWPNFGFTPASLGAALQVSLPAFGAGDPRRSFRAYGFQTEAALGTGCAPDPKRPVAQPAPRVALMDHAVGFVAAAIGIGALHAARRGAFEITHTAVADLAE